MYGLSVIGVDVAFAWLLDFTDCLRGCRINPQCGRADLTCKPSGDILVVGRPRACWCGISKINLMGEGEGGGSGGGGGWGGGVVGGGVGGGGGVGVGVGRVMAVADTLPWVGALVDLGLVRGACWSGAPSSSESPVSWNFSNRSSSERTTLPLDLAESSMKTRPS